MRTGCSWTSARRPPPLNRRVRATIRRPASDEELQRLYELRAQVFFGEGVLKQNGEPFLTDSLDRSPHAVNLVAVTPEDEIVGGARLAFPHDGWIPANTSYFDFRPVLPGQGATASCGSLLWVDRRYRRSRLAAIFARSVVALSAVNGMSHLCVAARPELREFLLAEGWEIVADEFLHPVEGVPVIPAIIDLVGRDVGAEFVLAGQSDIQIDRQAVLSTTGNGP